MARKNTGLWIVLGLGALAAWLIFKPKYAKGEIRVIAFDRQALTAEIIVDGQQYLLTSANGANLPDGRNVTVEAAGLILRDANGTALRTLAGLI